ncbi:VOC family protein [Lacticigenium naphthae]|uniref:VOC family protein n=1 Tax=Lacticigenium naphthae TaxID=515351 RepID=UPI00040B1948|nr:VOC family protein [Lacticigenium naphthae]
MKFHQAPVTYVGEVQLNVADLARSLAFYQDVLGFQVFDQTDTTATLTADGNRPLLSLTEIDNATSRNPQETGLFHFAILLPTRGDLGRFIRHLAQLEIPLGGGDHDVSEAVYFSDPDGNGIEVYRDRPSTEWEWDNGTVQMGTKELAAQSIMDSAPTEPWQGLPPETVMGHIHLQVNDLAAAEEFYTKGLGFDLTTRYGTGATFLSHGGYHHHVGLNTWNSQGGNPPEPNSVGLAAFTLEIPTKAEFQQVVAQLEDIGAVVRNSQQELRTFDPAGNAIILRIQTN